MELVKLNSRNIWDIVHLKVSAEQAEKQFVAPNDYSIMEAFAIREEGYTALPFGLYENGIAVGFLMIGYGTTDDADEPRVAEKNYCIWRLMIDARFQGRGLGIEAMKAALAYIRSWPCGKADRCWLSYDPENAAAESLYAKMGFVPNGEMTGDEVVAVLPL